MEQPSRQAQRPPAESEPDPPPQAGLASRLLVSFQYVHVQLAGGAPWGFTLRGGLEHGEPLLVSKVEDGGKAALSQKMRSGDELVNINGMPLYGSRQEALILIKGSYRTLKMIVRRRNVPVIRPHSWHLAKLSEARSDAATMPFPADAFSLLWHLGCDVSDLPRPWIPLSPPGPADRSSSPGSMESLEPPSQASCEGSLSPIDQAMYQNKRDSAYSSFSAGSNASDPALRPEEGSARPGQPAEARYLQTSGDPAEAAALPFLAGQQAPGAGLPPGGEPGSLPSPAHTAAAPPQPPVRQDSLRACDGPGEAPGPSPQEGSLCPQSQWGAEPSPCTFGQDLSGPEEQLALARPPKDPLPTDQYYLLSSHTDQHPQMEKDCKSPQAPWAEESRRAPPEEPPAEKKAVPKTSLTGAPGHRHSVPENLLAAQLRALGVSQCQEGPHWTVSPLHQSVPVPEPWLNQGHFSHRGCGPGADPCPPAAPGEGSAPPARSSGRWAVRPPGLQAELPSSLPPPLTGGATAAAAGLRAAPSRESLLEGGPAEEGGRLAAQKGSSAQHRPSQTRRRSDRFATNLRKEIQQRKAQLQKAKAPEALPGEEPTEAREQPPCCSSTPPPPLPEDRPCEPPPLPAAPLRRWGSELSLFGEGGVLGGHRRLPGDQAPPGTEPGKPQRALPPMPGGGRGGRWRWSPEHKLQPQDGGLPEETPPAEDSGLLPFADRRKFFEESSRPPPPPLCSGSPQRRQPGLRLPRAEEPEAFQPGCSQHRDPRRHSADQPRWSPTLPAGYQDFWPEVPLALPEWECWRSLPCSCAAREGHACCCRDRWAALPPRGPPGPPSHRAPHCHPCPWARCRDCCCPAQPTCLEEGGSWPARKPFPMEFPTEQWQPPAGNRGSSQSPREFFPHQAALARVSPFWTSFESAEPAWSAFRRTMPAHTLPRDCERPGRALESLACEEESREPCRMPRRGRSPPEELARAPRNEETGPTMPPGLARRRGPPPPRPPPPNWEKLHPRRASHNLLLPAEAAPPAPWEGSWAAPGQGGFEAARQRSQSLPLEQLCSNRSRTQMQPLQPPCPAPWEAPGHPEPGSPPSCCHSPSLRTLEWLMPEASEQSSSSRAAGSLDEEAPPEPLWDEKQKRPVGSPSEHPWAASPGRPLQEPEDTGGGGRCNAPPSRLDSEELRRDVAGRDRSLAEVLSSGLGLRSTAEVMGDLFAASDCSVWKGPDWDLPGSGPGGPDRQKMPPGSPGGGSATCLAYYSLSAGKAELLSKMKDQPEPEEEAVGQDLAQKKMQLIESISRKLVVLQEAQQSLQDDISANVALGREVESHVKGVCRPHEFEKFRLFIGDLDKVVHLLLSLSRRLARVENALGGLGEEEEEEEEKMSLLEKKRQLTAQLADAKDLQEHVAQRERLVFASIAHCLPAEQLRDYQHFVRMTSALAVQQRQLDEKIKLGEDQLRCLRESLARRPRER